MKRYEKYKPSGIDWIGEVPEHWDVMPLKHGADVIMGQSPSGEDIKDEGVAPFMQGNAEFGSKYPHSSYYCDNCSKHSRVGDILMSVRAPVGELNISDQVYGIGRGLCSIKSEKFDQGFLWFYLQKSKGDFNALANGSTFTAITVETLNNYPILLPPLAEQEAIAAYLDARCADIDKVVATQEKRIALLQELKQSEITQAVTRGLNPDARMKDSGVEWIGCVPEHWEVCKLKYFLNLINGRAYLQHELQEAGKYRILRVGNFFTNDQWYYSDFELEPEKYCEKGDLLFAWSASFGPYIWDEEKVIYHYHIWKVLLTRGFNKFYAYYMLQSLSDYKRKDVHGSTMTHITMESMNQTKIPVPSKDEQAFIVEYLDRRCGEIDKQIGAVTKQIDLLREYKQSLITEVVTGKRRV